MTARAHRPRLSPPAGYVPGFTVGQYRVTGVIGQGGMGAVYAAEHTLLGRPAAIKVLLTELSKRQDIVQRFFNEARAAAAIRHPGIVEIYDVGWGTDGSAYIVMERLQGETLARRAARGRLPWQGALAFARQIAGSLAAAHDKGIVHRDLKPDNIFLVADPEVPGGERIKLLDFGIAKLTDPSTGLRMTRTGAVLGTPTYMAPEQCRGVPVDHRADLYSLGCLIFKLCAGRAPFVGAGSGDVLAAHIYSPPPPLGAYVPEAPPEVAAIVERLLAKRPEDRPQRAEQVIQQIDAALHARRTAPRADPSRTMIGTGAVGAAGATAPEAPEATTLTHAIAPTGAITRSDAAATGAPTTAASVTNVKPGARSPLLWLTVAVVTIAVVLAIVIAMWGGSTVAAR